MAKYARSAVMIVFAAVFAVSVFFIGRHLLNQRESAAAFSALAELVERTEVELGAHSPEPGAQMAAEENGLPPRVMALRQLKAENEDLAGWIQIPGTAITYPVMQTPADSEYYLKRNFEKRPSNHGTPFIDAGCNLDTYDNLTIYGHHMKDGSMFAALIQFEEKDFYEAHRTLLFDTMQEAGEYEIIAVCKLRMQDIAPDGFQYNMFTKAEQKADFDAFMEQVHQFQLYDTGAGAEYGDTLVTLSTCEYSQENGRMVVVARKTN